MSPNFKSEYLKSASYQLALYLKKLGIQDKSGFGFTQTSTFIFKKPTFEKKIPKDWFPSMGKWPIYGFLKISKKCLTLEG